MWEIGKYFQLLVFVFNFAGKETINFLSEKKKEKKYDLAHSIFKAHNAPSLDEMHSFNLPTKCDHYHRTFHTFSKLSITLHSYWMAFI